jgi:hypothetical protein
MDGLAAAMYGIRTLNRVVPEQRMDDAPILNRMVRPGRETDRGLEESLEDIKTFGDGPKRFGRFK